MGRYDIEWLPGDFPASRVTLEDGTRVTVPGFLFEDDVPAILAMVERIRRDHPGV